MKNTIKILLSLLLLMGIFGNISHAASIKIISSGQVNVTSNTEVTRSEIFSFYADMFSEYIPESYKYIQLNYRDVTPNSPSYSDLQKLVYIDAIGNSRKTVHLSKTMNAYIFYVLSADIMGIKLVNTTSENVETLKARNTHSGDLSVIKKLLSGQIAPKVDAPQLPSLGKGLEYKKEIFFDVYETLLNKHYNKTDLDEERIINKAIQGLADGTDDKHTVYFPPVESQGFTDALNGEYEGIGAYVDMYKPGILEIVTPIVGSPSQKAGLKGGDIVTHVNKKEVTEKNSLKEVVSWIKGPAGTNVVLTILRDGESKDITVTRAKIIIKDIEYSKIDSRTAYIQMKSFGEKSSGEFGTILKKIKEDSGVKKIIFDLRNNGGGYLGEVSKILSHFIAKGEPVAVVKYLNRNQFLNSRGYEGINLNDYTLVVLQNSGTASASEIFIGTLKDYYSDITIIGEKSYGKGSVQTTKSYKDGSILKYTIARWYTGKSETGIDGVGISPDKELILDDERYLKDDYDNQLEAAKKIK